MNESTKTWLIIGGLAGAALIGFLVLRARVSEGGTNGTGVRTKAGYTLHSAQPVSGWDAYVAARALRN